MKNDIEVTPELLMEAFQDAKNKMFVENEVCIWNVANLAHAHMGFITLKNGKRALVSIRIKSEDKID